MSLPVNVHHPVVDLTMKFYARHGSGQRNFQTDSKWNKCLHDVKSVPYNFD